MPQIWKLDGLSHSELKAICNTAQDLLLSNVRASCALDLEWFKPDDGHDGHVAILGGGPSLVDMAREIRTRQSFGQSVWALNNAAVALPDIKIDAQVLLDARPDNTAFIAEADEYLVASQCDPSMFDALSGEKVTLWHANSPGMDFLKDEKERYAYLIGGGTTVGMNAIALAFLRGFRKIHLYGFDSCYRGDAHHAYPQRLNDQDRRSDVLYGGKNYVCAPWMVGQAHEFIELAPGYEADGCTITVHGTGLLQDISQDLAGIMTPADMRAHEILKRAKPGSRGVEIGVFAGDTSQALLKADPDLNLILVDSWEGDGSMPTTATVATGTRRCQTSYGAGLLS